MTKEEFIRLTNDMIEKLKHIKKNIKKGNYIDYKYHSNELYVYCRILNSIEDKTMNQYIKELKNIDTLKDKQVKKHLEKTLKKLL